MFGGNVSAPSARSLPAHECHAYWSSSHIDGKSEFGQHYAPHPPPRLPPEKSVMFPRNRRRRGARNWSAPVAAVQILEPRALLSATVVENDRVGYFLSDTTAQVLRYAAESWMTPVDLTSGVGLPSVLHVDAEGLYVAFNKAVYRYELDGSNETHLLDTDTDVVGIHSDGNLLFINSSAGRYASVVSINKQTNAAIDSANSYLQTLHSLYGSSLSPSVNRLFGRTNGATPTDIASLSYDDDGNFHTGTDSPYHASYPDASQTWTFPNGQRVVDDSGTVYSADSLTYLNSFPDSLVDVAFIGEDIPLVLSDNEVTVFTSSLLPAGSYSLQHSGQELFINDDNAIVFRFEGGQWLSDFVPLSALNPPQPGQPVDPVGLSYTPDQVEVAADGSLLLLSKAQQSIFRWDVQQQVYTDTIPLGGVPQQIAYSSVDNIVYQAYADGLITKVDLSSGEPAEEPLLTLSSRPVGFAVAGQYLFVDSNGQSTIDSSGNIVDSANKQLSSDRFVWSEPNQKFYFLTSSISPRDLRTIEVNQDGTTHAGLTPGGFGNLHDSPLHSSNGFVDPVHVSPDGNLVLLGSGIFHNAATLARLTTSLANSIDDAAWLGSTLLTVRANDGGSEVQKWEGASFQTTDTFQLDGTVHALVSVSAEHVVAVTLQGGVPVFHKLDANLQPVARPPRPLTLTAPADMVNESAGADAVSVTLSRTAGLSERLEVALRSDTTSAITVPATVTLAAGEESVQFFVSAVDDDLADGIQFASITATGRQYDTGEITIAVADNELVVVESEGETVVGEDGTTDTLLISLPSAPTEPVVVKLTPAEGSGIEAQPDELQFTSDNWDQPQTVTVSGSDDDDWDGSETSSITVAVVAHESDAMFASAATADITVTTLDDERPRPIVTMPDSVSPSPVVELSWIGVPMAEEYDLWLTHVGADASPITLSTSETYHQISDMPIGIYNFWVRADLTTGEQSAWGFGRFEVNKGVFVELSTTGDLDRSPSISWDPIPGATGYQVWANNLTTQQTGLVNTEVTEASFQFSDLSFGQHQIWVRPLGLNNFKGRWSAENRYYLGPNLNQTPRATFSNRPEFRWNTVEGVGQFRIWIAGPQGFRIDESGITDTTFTPNEVLVAGQYRWWIMPQTAEGRNGRWSSLGVVNVGGGATGLEVVGEPQDSSPVLRWNATEGAATYEVYALHVDSGEVDQYFDVADTELQFPLLLDGDYKIWVRPTDQNGQHGRWSPVFHYTLQTATENIAVTPTEPFISTFDTQVVFEWNSPTGADTFDLIYANADTEVETEVTGLTTTTFNPGELPRGTWIWSVRARTSSGAAGPWSDHALFDTQGRIALEMPRNSATYQPQPTFHWTSVQEADRYSFLIVDDATGETVIRDDHVSGTSYRPETPLAVGVYRLWVKALSNSDSSLGVWSRMITLTVRAAS